MATVFLNGSFLPLEQACVSVLDRGFLLGDGVYEVIPAYGGRLFRLDHHLLRLAASLAGIRIPEPMATEQWRTMLAELVARNAGADQSVYLQITRGTAAKRDHHFPDPVNPTVFAMSTPIAPPPDGLDEDGVAAITLDDIRWQHCHIKAITLLPNVLLRQQAVDAGAVEAILIRDGLATEGAASNLFVVRDGTLITPPKGPTLLPGITRDLILELADAHGIPAREVDIPQDQLHDADEVWLTSSTREILPVTRLDERPVGSGAPGPVYGTMAAHYRAYKEAVRRGEAD
ncbi:MAG TPA: D-amino acid aminotransferase [Gammaproteobacteria bacterium]|nr:D-amino acid aminotransferase [Gammaproteobacteria bacterium]